MPRSRGTVSSIKTNKWDFPSGPLGKPSPVQGTWVQSLVWEDPTCCRATKPKCYNYWSPCTKSPQHAPQQQKRSHCNEKPSHSWELESSPLSQQLDKAWVQQRRSSTAKNKIKINPKKNKIKKWSMLLVLNSKTIIVLKSMNNMFTDCSDLL